MNSQLSTLKQVASGEITPDQANNLLRQFKRTLRLQLSKNGTVSLFGLQKRPIVLYPDQWNRLADGLKTNLLSDFLLESENTNTKLSTLEKIANGSLSAEDADEQFKQFKRTLRFQKGKNETIFLLGLQKRPLILFQNQWTKLSEFLTTDTLATFLEDNKNELIKSKESATETTPSK